MAGLEKREYLQTSSDGNIISYLWDTFITNIPSALYREIWTSTLFCLRKLYETDVSELLAKLLEEDAEKELKKMKKLLDESHDGLINLKTVYKAKQSTHPIENNIEDYLDEQLEHSNELLQDKKDT